MILKTNNDNITIFVNKLLANFEILEKEKLEEYIKKLLVRVKKNYKLKISGSYNVNIYQNNNFGLIIEMIKQDNLDFFPDLIDLKINVFYDSEIYLKLNDYFLIDKYNKIYYYKNKFYINISEIEYKDQLCLSEFCIYIYGNYLNRIKNKLCLMK